MNFKVKSFSNCLNNGEKCNSLFAPIHDILRLQRNLLTTRLSAARGPPLAALGRRSILELTCMRKE